MLQESVEKTLPRDVPRKTGVIYKKDAWVLDSEDVNQHPFIVFR